MKTLTLAIFLFSVITSNADQTPEGDRLVRLAVVFRHGDRTPDDPYPTGPYADQSNWPDGIGHLTIRGKKRMLDVGRLIRKRYHNFMSHNPLEVYARSSPVSRCLSSTALVLAGAYPPTHRLKIDDDLDWQPIPVHTEREPFEMMLVSPNKFDCPASLVAENLQQDAPDVLAFQQENSEFMKQVSLFTGSNITRLRDISTIYDNLKIDQEEGKRLPGWATKEVMQQLWVMDQKIYCVNSSTRALQRLHAGPFYHDLKNVFLNNSFPGRKVFFYCTHDTRMSSLMRGLNAYDGGAFEYGSTLFFELWQTIYRGLIVRVFFWRDTCEHKVQELKPRLCERESVCPVNCFFDGLQNYTTDPDTHNAECRMLAKESDVTGCFP